LETEKRISPHFFSDYEDDVKEGLARLFECGDIEESEYLVDLNQLYLDTNSFGFKMKLDDYCAEHEICPICLHGHICYKKVGYHTEDIGGSNHLIEDYTQYCDKCGEEF
jgi:hypothetical protein